MKLSVLLKQSFSSALSPTFPSCLAPALLLSHPSLKAVVPNHRVLARIMIVHKNVPLLRRKYLHYLPFRHGQKYLESLLQLCRKFFKENPRNRDLFLMSSMRRSQALRLDFFVRFFFFFLLHGGTQTC